MATQKKTVNNSTNDLDYIVQWRVNTVAMLKEMVENNPQMGIFKQPVNILGRVLGEVANRAIELNDPKLNQLMCRLALYEQSDPYAKGYDKKKTEYVLSKNYLKDCGVI
jgi:hypothetical protein